MLRSLQRFLHTMRAIQGSMIVSSFLNMIIGYNKLWGNYSRFFSPVSVVPVICVVGLGLFERLGKCVEIGLPMLIFLVVFQQNMQDEMMDLMEVSSEIQGSLVRSYNVPDDIDEEELMGELDALEADMGTEVESDGVPSYLQPDKDPDLDSELNWPSTPIGQGGAAPSRYNTQNHNLHASYDFHSYMIRSMEEEFHDIVGIRYHILHSESFKSFSVGLRCCLVQ